MLKSGISEEFKGLWLGEAERRNKEQEEYIIKLRDVVLRGNPWCLVVAGTFGNGKSYLAQVALNTFNNNGFLGGLYTTQPIIQSELWDGNTSNGEILRKYMNAPVLIIDEISDRPNDWTQFIKTNIENILIERHRLNLPTVLIGNIDFERLILMFDARVRDRLKEGLVQVMTEKTMRENNG